MARVRTLSSLFIAVGLLLGLPMCARAQDDAAAEGLLSRLVDRINARDRDALDEMIHEDALFVLDMPYDQLVLDKAGVLDGPHGLVSAAQQPLSFSLTDLQVYGGIAFSRGTIEIDGVNDEAGFLAGALSTPDGWRLALLVITAPEEPPAGIPAELTAITEPIMRGAVNGMQAGARHLAERCIFVLGLPGAPMEFGGPKAITQNVSAWPPPEDVEVTGGGQVSVNRMCALLTFDSSLLTGATRLDLHSVVCLVNQNGAWRVLGFLAGAKAVEAVPVAP